jgi:glycosyltransferase involved in cell wall biosynthesis
LGKLSVVVPCFNEQEAIPLFYQEATSVLQRIHCDYQIFFVNDGSRDRSLEVIEDLASKDPRVKYISFSRNFGKEAAMLAGMEYATGDLVVIMDVDLQDPPALLPEMIEAIEREGYDSVATRRVSRTGEPPVRSFFARVFYKLINKLSEADIVDGARDYRMMTRQMVNSILEMNEYHRFSKGIFGWVGYETKWIAYENIERVAGETKWSFWKLLKYALEGIIAFSTTPLRVVSVFGIVFSGFAFLLFVLIIFRRLLFGDPVAGWASTMSVIILVSGLQMIFLGIMGEYIARTYMETKARPKFFVKKKNI